MASGCLMCNNLIIYRYLNRTTRCPFCYLSVTCDLVFKSLIQLINVHGTKTVVLGGSSPRTIAVLEDKLDPYGPRVQHAENGVEKPIGSSWYGRSKHREEMAKPKAPRKTVSINHNVEYIDDYLSNKKRKSNAMEQWPSSDTKPLKSILKVGSRLR